MPRPPAVALEERTRLVLAILAGEMSIAEAVHRVKVSEQSVGKWKGTAHDRGRWRPPGTPDAHPACERTAAKLGSKDRQRGSLPAHHPEAPHQPSFDWYLGTLPASRQRIDLQSPSSSSQRTRDPPCTSQDCASQTFECLVAQCRSLPNPLTLTAAWSSR